MNETSRFVKVAETQALEQATEEWEAAQSSSHEETH